MRIALGVVSGVAADYLSGLDPPNALVNGVAVGLVFFMASYYAARYGIYRNLPRDQFAKLYTTGIGGFIMAFLFTWVLVFTYFVYSA